METEKFKITCKFPNCKESRIQADKITDQGYSNWTVEESGYLELKCHTCGTYAIIQTTTQEAINTPHPANQKPEYFEIKCKRCNNPNVEYIAGDVDGEAESTLRCNNCGEQEYGENIVLERNNKQEEKQMTARVSVGRMDNNKIVEVADTATIKQAIAAGGYTMADNDVIRDIDSNEYTGDEEVESGKGFYLCERVKSGKQ